MANDVIPVPEQPGRLYLVPPMAENVVWEKESQPLTGPAPTEAQLETAAKSSLWAIGLKKWGPWLAIPGVLLVASYWGPPRGPVFRR